jgi:hypothetical protein
MTIFNADLDTLPRSGTLVNAVNLTRPQGVRPALPKGPAMTRGCYRMKINKHRVPISVTDSCGNHYAEMNEHGYCTACKTYYHVVKPRGATI